MLNRLLLILTLSVVSASSFADESALRLAPSPDQSIVLARCSVCHSVDYIQMNAPFLKRPQWEAEVKKMIKTYGAPVSDEEAVTIVDYLVQNYGAANAAP